MSTISFPDGQVITVEASGPDFVFSAVLPPRHAGPPAHRHRRETEVFTVESGLLEVRLGRERRLLQPGETLAVPPGTTHGFANPFDEPVRLRTVETPPVHCRPSCAPSPPRMAGRRCALARINAEHDFSFTAAGLPDGPQRVLWRLLARWASA